MPRVKGGVVSRRRRKKVLKLAKGYFGSKHRLFKVANQQVMKSYMYAYRDRRQKKRDFRKLWIARINAAARLNGISYSKLMFGLKQAGIEVNRKMLSEIAIADPAGFTALVDKAKNAGTVTAPGKAKAAKPAAPKAVEKPVAPKAVEKPVAPEAVEKSIAPVAEEVSTPKAAKKPAAEKVEAAEVTPVKVVAEDTVYYTPNGKSYHSTEACTALAKSKIIKSATLAEAIETGHADPCDFCIEQ